MFSNNAIPVLLILILTRAATAILEIDLYNISNIHRFLTDDQFTSQLQIDQDYKQFFHPIQECASNPRSQLAAIYTSLPKIIKLLIKKKSTPTTSNKLWLTEASYLHTGNLKAALIYTTMLNQQKERTTTAADLLDLAHRLLRLLQGNVMQYTIFKGPDQDLNARDIFIAGCAESGGRSRHTIKKIIEAVDGEKIKIAEAANIVCNCLGNSITIDQDLWPVWKSRRYHELELSKMIMKTSVVGLTCVVDPIVASVKKHPKSGKNVMHRLMTRIPLEFAGAMLKGDAKIKLGPIYIVATYGWSNMLQKMFDNGACVDEKLYRLILNHVESIFRTIMPILIVAKKCSTDTTMISNWLMPTTMKLARRQRDKLHQKFKHPGTLPLDKGGWKQGTKQIHAKCDIDSIHVDDISEIKILRDYVYGNKPLIIRGALLSSKYKRLRKMFKKKVLIRKLHKSKLEHSKIPYPRLFLRTASNSTIRKYLREQQRSPNPTYIFTVCPPIIKNAIKNTLPTYFGNDLSQQISLCEFYVGVEDSGSPPHFHVMAINFLMYGEKQWILLPPISSLHSRTPAKIWWNQDIDMNEKTSMLHCVQYAGDLLLVPKFWTHSTINNGDSVGFAMEFITSATFPYAKQPKEVLVV